MNPASTVKVELPLCVDLDGTLVATDTLWESIWLLIRRQPLFAFLLPLWLLKGNKASFKEHIAQRLHFPARSMPYREEILTFLRQARHNGQTLILVTAANYRIAHAVADYLDLFDEVLASDAQINLKGEVKRDVLVQRFGQQGFAYLGDSLHDLPIFRAAGQIYLVVPFPALPKDILQAATRCFTAPVRKHLWLTALRPQQWAKNLLLFIPILFAHQLFDLPRLIHTLTAFVAFSVAASAGYLLNDLLDLMADRSHPVKKYRPFASGQLPISHGLPLIVLLISISLILSLFLITPLFFGMIVFYLGTTMLYSFYLKRKLILDVLVLAGLYTHRIVAGGIAAEVIVSSWLLAFSMFFFTSLAFLKRYIELLPLSEGETIKHRNYCADDVEMVASVGPTSGYLAVLVFSLYINSDVISDLYSSPSALWFICPALLYWISRIWFIAHRKQLTDDPIQFALTDRVTWAVGAIISLFLLGATLL